LITLFARDSQAAARPVNVCLLVQYRPALETQANGQVHPSIRPALLRQRSWLHPPGCDVPGYNREVHYVEDWAATRTTDIDQLTLACGPHHKLIDKNWTTRKRVDGDTEWITPPHLDHGQLRTNMFHHPEKLLCDNGDDEDDP
jgi:hypothetical protein